MGIEELRVRYEHDANCSKTNWTPTNERGFRTCLDCAGQFDAATGLGLWTTDKRFDSWRGDGEE